MKIVFLDRKFNPNEISFEKLFGFVKKSISDRGIVIQNIENPFGNGIVNLFKSILFFRKSVKNDSIVHITGQIHFAAIALKTNKIVITVHDLGLYRNLSFIRFLIFKVFWVYLPFRKAKVIVAISEKTKQEIVQMMPSVARKVVVIPNCVTMDIAEDFVTDKAKTTKILIVGTRANKNIERSIKALQDLPVEVFIVGKLEIEYEDLLRSNKIAYHNCCNISDEELKALYLKTDVLLFASIYEGFGLPILEAQAQNTLVITSNILPMSDVGGEGVILVDPNSVESIKKGLNIALNLSNDEKIEIIRKGKDNLKRFSVEHVSNLYIEIYESL